MFRFSQFAAEGINDVLKILRDLPVDAEALDFNNGYVFKIEYAPYDPATQVIWNSFDTNRNSQLDVAIDRTSHALCSVIYRERQVLERLGLQDVATARLSKKEPHIPVFDMADWERTLADHRHDLTLAVGDHSLMLWIGGNATHYDPVHAFKASYYSNYRSEMVRIDVRGLSQAQMQDLYVAIGRTPGNRRSY